MRKLLGLAVVLAALGVCTPSYGYILAYKVTGGMKAVEWNSGKIISVPIKGYGAIDVNDSNGAVNDKQIVLYGKDASGNLKYFADSLDEDLAGIYWDTTNDTAGVVEVDIWDYNSPFNYEFVMTGNVKLTDVGAGSKKLAASSLSGSLITWWAQLLDDNQELFGSGAATMTLDTKQSKAANTANIKNPGAITVNDVISDFIVGLQAKGYHPIVLTD
jgi:hypothetical protein